MPTRIALTLVHPGAARSGISTRPRLARGLELAFAQPDLDVVAA